MVAVKPVPPSDTLVQQATDANIVLADLNRDAAIAILAKHIIDATPDGEPIRAKKLTQLPSDAGVWQAVLDEMEAAIERAGGAT